MDGQTPQPTSPPQTETTQPVSPPPSPSTSSGKQTLFYLVGAVILLVLVIGGIYFGFSYLTNSQKNGSAQTSTSQASRDSLSPRPNQSGPNTHTSEKYGWSIVYPEGIYLTMTNEAPDPEGKVLETVEFSSVSPDTNVTASQSDSLNLRVQTLTNSTEQNLETIANEYSAEENAKNDLGGFEVSPINVQNLQGYMVNFEGNAVMSGWTDIYLPGQNQQNLIRIRYNLLGEGLRNTADEMVSSFKII